MGVRPRPVPHRARKRENVLANMADFKKHFDLHVEPGGWRPADEGEPEAR